MYVAQGEISVVSITAITTEGSDEIPSFEGIVKIGSAEHKFRIMAAYEFVNRDANLVMSGTGAENQPCWLYLFAPTIKSPMELGITLGITCNAMWNFVEQMLDTGTGETKH